MRARPSRGKGDGGQHGFVRAAAAAPNSVPAICLSLRPDQGGGGAPRRGLTAPAAPGVQSASPVLGPRAASSKPKLPFPWRRPMLLGPPFPPAPQFSDRRPSREAARSQRHPHPHPSHDLKRRKWCPGPQPHFRRPASPRDSLRPLTPSTPTLGSLS
ncbi:hypothetical protein P7K49_017891 [Saguinus oedipus]|uniref:Uncharacterized protein n=1 Tax=Saguinus oedipus TaxID=9490 RepID=A0ABQ9V4H5_SAGOE|nr:hypothetical protein P7K49_017891 [Saguinus oedipus]